MKFHITKPRLLPSGKRADSYGYRVILESPYEDQSLRALFPTFKKAGTGRGSKVETEAWLHQIRKVVEHRAHLLAMGQPVGDTASLASRIAEYAEWGKVQGGKRGLPWAAGLSLEVTGIKVERLQDITEEQAEAEGVEFLFTAEECATTVGLIGSAPRDQGFKNYLWHGLVGKSITAKQADAWPYQYSGYKTGIESFSSLWESINGAGSWDLNPWVWAVSFKKVAAGE